MAFSPEKPSSPEDLMVYCDGEADEIVIFIYDADEDGMFYRYEGEWRELLSPEDEYDINLDDLILVYVDPAFIPVYDEAEELDEIIPVSEVLEYESTGPEDWE